MKKIDYFALTLNIIMWIFGVIVIYWLILRIVGKSPEVIDVVLGLVFILAPAIIHIYYKLGGMEEFKLNVKDSFSRVREDMQDIKNDLKEIKNYVKK